MRNPESAVPSPLAMIRDKERSLAAQIQAAEESANALLADARARVDALQQEAERVGMRDAEALYQEGLARARQEADAIRAAGEADATHLLKIGRERVDRAVDYIVQFVLPHTG